MLHSIQLKHDNETLGRGYHSVMPKIILTYVLIFSTGSFYLDSAYAKSSHDSCNGKEIYATKAFNIKMVRDNVSDEEITRMANESNIHAMLWLASKYNLGNGVKKDKDKARKWTLKAAQHGSGEAKVSLAFYYPEKPQTSGPFRMTDSELKWLKQAADEGYVYAQLMMAWHYTGDTGTDVRAPADFEQVTKWLLLAAKNGCADAQYGLGQFYLRGKSVGLSNKQAYMWYLIGSEIDSSYDEKQMKDIKTGLEKNLKKTEIDTARDEANQWLAKFKQKQ